MIWVIVSNSTDCRIYEYKKPSSLVLIKEMRAPENRLRDIEITTDKPGRYKSGTGRGAYSPRTDPKEINIDDFSRAIAHELEKGRTQNAYTQIIMVSPPHFIGLLNNHMTKHVKALISNHIRKDILTQSLPEILAILHSEAKFPDPKS